MDTNMQLAQFRELMKTANLPAISPEARADLLARAAQTMEALDTEVTNNGRLPGDWTPVTPLPVALPDPIDPESITMGLALSVCQSCPVKMDGWLADEDAGPLYQWQEKHRKETGHHKFHVWRISRNEARILNLPTA